ncbi:MAG: DUF362 domain-containing protein, partial [Candidatus Thorarchaeota archaeon]|nr:DUF362 domain-containing protein [Candidatus Thorarchaeota archaeon]
IRPAYVRTIVEYVKKRGGIPFVADTCSLGYGTSRPYGGRTTAVDYYERAAMNGYTQSTVGSPIIIADGYWGADFLEYEIEGDFLKSVPVPAALFDADKIIVLSHSKFHHIGLASTLKNIGVGLVAKKGKAAVHSPYGLEIDSDECKGESCALCVSVCPTRCIIVKGTLSVDMNRCIQCGHCSSICASVAKAKALKLTWSGQNMAEKIVENTHGVLKAIGSEKFYFVNLAIDISDMCDCVCYGAPLLMHDLGVFGSRDPLALDIATANAMTTADRNTAAEASAKIDELLRKSDSFFEHGAKMKIGSQEYELVNLSQNESK